MTDHLLLAAFLTLLAGLATGIGSAIAFFANHTNKKFLSFSLGLSAGVMVYVSFVELFASAQGSLTELYGKHAGGGLAVGAFFLGICLAALIDKVVPDKENPHEMRSVEEMNQKPAVKSKLMRTGLITALAITIHNFPEGMATFAATLENPELGIAIAVAIAIHNIPEGIAVSVPIYYATGSRKKAFLWSFLSGMSEPLGALIGWLILMPFMSPLLMNCVLAAVGGIMVFISFDELLPAAREYGEHHVSIYGLIAGMAVMAVSLTLL
ncbi:MAG: zinc transporter ZupT [Rikenellaceae bacterium]|jgi:ZIP family zinc transporter|nr:zinc transporter ZupT [Rikenellaceae bacterium]